MTIVALGLLVGLILALTGAGGTIVAVPLLMFGLQLDLAHAAPIALLAVATAAAVGTVLGLRAGIVRYRAAMLMAAIGAACSPMGVLLAQRLPPAPLTLLFAAVLLYVARRMFQGAGDSAPLPAEPPCQLDPATGRLRWTWRCLHTLGGAGALGGLLSGLLGVGGGFVIVPALRRATDLPMQAVVASSLMVIMLVSGAGAVGATLAGHLDLQTAWPFAAATLAGMLAGRRLASRLSGPRLQRGFAVTTALVALGMVGRLALT